MTHQLSKLKIFQFYLDWQICHIQASLARRDRWWMGWKILVVLIILRFHIKSNFVPEEVLFLSQINSTISIAKCLKVCNMRRMCSCCCCCRWCWCCCCCCCCCCCFASFLTGRSVKRREESKAWALRHHFKSSDQHDHHGRTTINGEEFEDLNIICKLSICKETHNQQHCTRSEKTFIFIHFCSRHLFYLHW